MGFQTESPPQRAAWGLENTACAPLPHSSIREHSGARAAHTTGRAQGQKHLRFCSGSPAERYTRELSLCGAETPATVCPALPWRTSQRSLPGEKMTQCVCAVGLPTCPHPGAPTPPHGPITMPSHLTTPNPGAVGSRVSLEATESPPHSSRASLLPPASSTFVTKAHGLV